MKKKAKSLKEPVYKVSETMEECEDCVECKAISLINWMTIGAIVLFVCGAIFLCNSCTTSVTTISSHGTASDMVDQQQDANPNISPTLSIPVK